MDELYWQTSLENMDPRLGFLFWGHGCPHEVGSAFEADPRLRGFSGYPTEGMCDPRMFFCHGPPACPWFNDEELNGEETMFDDPRMGLLWRFADPRFGVMTPGWPGWCHSFDSEDI
jgi:hypothetical protein